MDLKSILKKGLIVGGIMAALAMPLKAQELPKNLNIPQKFENYREKGHKLPYKDYDIGGFLVHANYYDLDGDGNMDVREIYPIISFDEGDKITKEPLFYGFDINNNGNFEPEEILVDEELDGLNGNEEWINERIIKNLKKNYHSPHLSKEKNSKMLA